MRVSISFKKDLFTLKPGFNLVIIAVLVSIYFISKYIFNTNPIKFYIFGGSIYLILQGLLGLLAERNLLTLKSEHFEPIRIQGKIAKIWAMLMILAGLLFAYGYFNYF